VWFEVLLRSRERPAKARQRKCDPRPSLIQSWPCMAGSDLVAAFFFASDSLVCGVPAPAPPVAERTHVAALALAQPVPVGDQARAASHWPAVSRSAQEYLSKQAYSSGWGYSQGGQRVSRGGGTSSFSAHHLRQGSKQGSALPLIVIPYNNFFLNYFSLPLYVPPRFAEVENRFSQG